jgi:hypothetical protein
MPADHLFLEQVKVCLMGVLDTTALTLRLPTTRFRGDDLSITYISHKILFSSFLSTIDSVDLSTPRSADSWVCFRPVSTRN